VIILHYKLNTLYFSATSTTKKVISGIGERLLEAMKLKQDINNIDFTLSKTKEKSVSFSKDNIVIVGVPVYAGRVPNILLKYLNSIKGNGALAIAVVVYGNRNYDDALIELRDILELDGFKVIAGAAFIGQHSFSKTLAKNRPDEKDMEIVRNFADRIYNKIISETFIKTLFVNGDKPYRNYYMSRDEEGEPIDIRKVKPKTKDSCIDCKLCATVCPMGSINLEDVTKVNGICIKCCACIKKCPVEAKYFDDIGYLKHKEELEINFIHRKEPKLFL